MRLRIEDFKRENTWYSPCKELIDTNYWRQLEESDKWVEAKKRKEPVNWVFNIEKSEVFDYLGWEKAGNKSHDEDSSMFPEFVNHDQLYLFITIAIKLHNEKYETRAV